MQHLLSMFAYVTFLQLEFKNHEKVISVKIYHITLQEFVFNDDQKRVGPVSPESGFLNRDRVKARRFSARLPMPNLYWIGVFMNIKSLLLGSAAALAVVSGAQAADAIVAAEPEPLEYVRICDAFGAGYFYIPG